MMPVMVTTEVTTLVIPAGQAEEVLSLELMLKQLFVVLTECVAQPIENLSLLGCSCIR